MAGGSVTPLVFRRLGNAPSTAQGGWRSRVGFWFGGLNAVASVAPPTVTTEDGPHGPGWNLFQNLPGRNRRVDTLREDLERLVSKAAGEPQQAQETEAREIVAEIVREASSEVLAPDTRPLIAALEHLNRLDLQARAYFERLQIVLDEQRAREADDLEAFMLMAVMM